MDTRSFNATIGRAIKASGRTAQRVINGHAIGVLDKAIDMTQSADRDQIAQILGQTGNQLNFTKKGDRLKKRAKGKALIKENSFAARIVNARIKEHAGPDFMLWGNALEQAARKLIAARQRSVRFILVGWIWALRDMGRARSSKKSKNTRAVKVAGQKKGSATPAAEPTGFLGRTLVARIENTSLVESGGKFQSKGHHNPLPIAEKGLSLAMKAEEAEMERHMAEEMKKAMREAGAL